ncbi:hypothetical protein [Pseudoroseicyclus aestuarii]|uniref:Uncharacterized protein n=1 Tax=Pseudoroseicyclus aestuarii TaxID=1795041 RepID=A0A318SUD3_9RHOB|nr:hypothetical protein [Pseudoroseicyclus aestuarii]PYE83979.1 hypothetical protein DFP88_103341 [Pseudoroseicyclus aestuarii]
MIIPLVTFLIGAAIGAFRAKRRGGNFRDMAQWGVGHGMLLGMLGLALLIVLLNL